MMNLTIFGGSRGVGLAARDIARARGYNVTTVARSNVATTGVTTIVGDVLDRGIVARALDGADAALVALGTAPSRRDSGAQAEVCSRGTGVVLDVMRERGLRRVVVVTSYGVGPTVTRRPFPFNLVAATFLRDVMADKEVQEELVRASDAEWTIVQPLGLTDAPASGRPYVAADGSRRVTRVSRADVATVCLDAIAQHAYLGDTIAVSADA